MREPASGAPRAAPPATERILLVGFMGAGKSTVGRILADRLAWGFVDLDDEVERLAGLSIRDIFRARGEAEFRRLESEATARLDDRRRIVVATGGGWMARPELRDRWPDAIRVWLMASVTSVRARLAGHFPSRPLLDRDSPEEAMREILRSRLPAYALAEIRVDTDGRTAVDVAGCILARLAGPDETGGGVAPPWDRIS